jgi:hypothetical protein
MTLCNADVGDSIALDVAIVAVDRHRVQWDELECKVIPSESCSIVLQHAGSHASEVRSFEEGTASVCTVEGCSEEVCLPLSRWVFDLMVSFALSLDLAVERALQAVADGNVSTGASGTFEKVSDAGVLPSRVSTFCAIDKITSLSNAKKEGTTEANLSASIERFPTMTSKGRSSRSGVTT